MAGTALCIQGRRVLSASLSVCGCPSVRSAQAQRFRRRLDVGVPVSVGASLLQVYWCACMPSCVRAPEGFWDGEGAADRNWCQVPGPLWKQEAAHRCMGLWWGLGSPRFSLSP